MSYIELVLSKNFKKSATLKEIAKKKGMSMSDAVKSIKTRSKIKQAIVKAGARNKELLNVKFAMMSTNKFLELVRRYKKKVNYPYVLRDFKKWLRVQQKSFKG